eukprot:12909754-Prorocentrum_lima.AAC.1
MLEDALALCEVGDNIQIWPRESGASCDEHMVASFRIPVDVAQRALSMAGKVQDVTLKKTRSRCSPI